MAHFIVAIIFINFKRILSVHTYTNISIEIVIKMLRERAERKRR